MSPSTPTGDSTIWPLFQTVLGVRALSTSSIHPLDVYVFRPSSKSRLSASPVTFLLGGVFLIKRHRGSVIYISSPILSFSLGYHTAIELHQRQLLHSLSPLLQSRLLSLTGSAIITIHLTDSLRLIPEKLRELWIIPIFFLLVTGTSLGVAWLLGNLFRLKPSQRYPASLSHRWKSHFVLPEILRWQPRHS